MTFLSKIIPTKLIGHYEQRQDNPHCILYAGKHLNVDPYAEYIYGLLIR